MKIISIYPSPTYTNEQIDRLKKLGEVQVLDRHNLSKEEFVRLTSNADCIITVPSIVEGGFSKDVLAKLPNLKLISLITVGFTGIDVAAAKELGITISNAKGSNSEAVAEHIWGMILSLSKRITEANRDMHNQAEYRFSSYKGQELYQKTIGIIGLGDIGKRVARIAKAFDMRVLGINKSGTPVEGIELTTLDTLLEQADVITVTVPLNDETRNLIDSDQLSKMKENVILINCAREEIVNKEAVIDAIQNKKIFGYGVERDLMTPISAEDGYFKYPNIVITPHTAFYSAEADEKSNDFAIENIERFLQGKPIRTI